MNVVDAAIATAKAAWNRRPEIKPEPPDAGFDWRAGLDPETAADLERDTRKRVEAYAKALDINYWLAHPGTAPQGFNYSAVDGLHAEAVRHVEIAEGWAKTVGARVLMACYHEAMQATGTAEKEAKLKAEGLL